MIRAALISLLFATAVEAEDAPTKEPQAECQSCSARHKALQKLQERRLTAPAPINEDASSAPTATEDE